MAVCSPVSFPYIQISSLRIIVRATTDVNLQTHHSLLFSFIIIHHLPVFGVMLAVGVLAIEHSNLNASIEVEEKKAV
jgi:hypothetical protein